MFILIFLFLIVVPLTALERFTNISPELKTRKLYAPDFKELGIEYLASLRTHLDIKKIIPAKPYPENRWKPLLEQQRAERVKQIIECYHAPVYVKYIDDNVGFGLFANAPVRAFDTVGEYTGYLCVEQEDDEEHDNAYSIDLGPYYDENKAPLFIDAKSAGNYTRFMNHSRMPNVNSLNVYSKYDGLWHVIMHANQDVTQDEQLLINYESEFWDAQGIEPVDLTPNP